MTCSFRHNRCQLKSWRIGKYARIVHCTRNCTTVNRHAKHMATYVRKAGFQVTVGFPPGKPREGLRA